MKRAAQQSLPCHPSHHPPSRTLGRLSVTHAAPPPTPCWPIKVALPPSRRRSPPSLSAPWGVGQCGGRASLEGHRTEEPASSRLPGCPQEPGPFLPGLKGFLGKRTEGARPGRGGDHPQVEGLECSPRCLATRCFHNEAGAGVLTSSHSGVSVGHMVEGQ